MAGVWCLGDCVPAGARPGPGVSWSLCAVLAVARLGAACGAAPAPVCGGDVALRRRAGWSGLRGLRVLMVSSRSGD